MNVNDKMHLDVKKDECHIHPMSSTHKTVSHDAPPPPITLQELMEGMKSGDAVPVENRTLGSVRNAITIAGRAWNDRKYRAAIRDGRVWIWRLA